MAKGHRRRLRGKKLLIVSGAIAGVSMLGCGDDATANLIAPPDTGAMDTGTGDGATDSAVEDTGVVLDSMIDAPVANLIAPPDTGPDSASDAASDAASDGSIDAS